MSPLDFLDEELENVQQALDETLRHDYGPQRSLSFYLECESRLQNFRQLREKLTTPTRAEVASLLSPLRQLADWISHVERSHLGEFSWFFAHELDSLACWLLSHRRGDGEQVDPLTHIIGEGRTYKITSETVTSATLPGRKFVFIFYPQRLKHHVLLHALFGHELCHAALRTNRTGAAIANDVHARLEQTGPLSNDAAINTWVNDPSAPSAHRQSVQKDPFHLPERIRKSWIGELSCDLFGLALFGPAFLAAFRVYIGSSHTGFEIRNSKTKEPFIHPPMAVRMKLLIQALSAFGWDKPISKAGTPTHAAETKFLEFLLEDHFDNWAQFYTAQEVVAICTALQQLMSKEKRQYLPLEPALLEQLVHSLAMANPPVLSGIDDAGVPSLRKLGLAQVLYSGWVYWIGRAALPEQRLEHFIDVNRMCDLALAQNAAIACVIDKKVQ